MGSSDSKQKKTTAVYFALLLIGLILGAGVTYTISQSQISGLETQVGQLRSDLTGGKAELEKAKAPRVPASVPVTLDPKTTALLLLDFRPANCYRRASCNATLPNVQGLLAKARSAGVAVLYTNVPVRELSNRTGDTVLTNDRGANKFYATELENWLKGKGIKTVIIGGVAANGAVLYTAFEAALRGFTVIVPTDAIASDNEYIQTYTLFQLLNQPGRSNPENKPLAPTAITLSSTTLITFGP